MVDFLPMDLIGGGNLDKISKYNKNSFIFQIVNTGPAVPVRLFGILEKYLKLFLNGLNVTKVNKTIINSLDNTTDSVLKSLNVTSSSEQIVSDVAFGSSVISVVTQIFVQKGEEEPFYVLEVTPLVQDIHQDLNVTKSSKTIVSDVGGNSVDVIKSLSVTSESFNIVTDVTPGASPIQTDPKPFILDGNFATDLTASALNSGNKTISELWSYVLQNMLILKHMKLQNTAYPEICLQKMIVDTFSPFSTPSQEIVDFGRYKNEYEHEMGLVTATDIDVLINANRNLELMIYPGTNIISLYFQECDCSNRDMYVKE